MFSSKIEKLISRKVSGRGRNILILASYYCKIATETATCITKQKLSPS